MDPIAIGHSHRIRYEAFAKLASEANRARNYDELARALQKNLKFLLLYYLARFTFIRRKDVHTFQIHRAQIGRIGREGDNYRAFEESFRDNPVPRKYAQQEIPALPDLLVEKGLAGTVEELHVIPIAIGADSFIITTIATKSGKIFSDIDYKFCKMVAEYLENKVSQLMLHKEVQDQYEQLKKAAIEIEKRNQQISQIMEDQEEIIRKRTRELEIQNQKLMNYAFMNSHEIRGPLSRILGVLYISEDLEMTAENRQYFEYIRKSANELDHEIKRLNALIHEENGELILDTNEDDSFYG